MTISEMLLELRDVVDNEKAARAMLGRLDDTPGDVPVCLCIDEDSIEIDQRDTVLSSLRSMLRDIISHSRRQRESLTFGIRYWDGDPEPEPEQGS